MTAGPRLVLEVVSEITSLDASDRGGWAGAAGSYLDDYDGLDDDERRAVSPGHVWCMCIEPSIVVRESFLDSIDALAVRRSISPTMVAEVLGWLAQTGSDPRGEIDFVESLRQVVERTGAVPEVALTPERAAPFVDVLRGITSASEPERVRAARIVPDLLPDLRREEQWGFTGVLARAAVVEDDAGVRGDQLEVLAVAHRVGAVHVHDGHLLARALADVSLGAAERRIVDALRDGGQ